MSALVIILYLSLLVILCYCNGISIIREFIAYEMTTLRSMTLDHYPFRPWHCYVSLNLHFLGVLLLLGDFCSWETVLMLCWVIMQVIMHVCGLCELLSFYTGLLCPRTGGGIINCPRLFVCPSVCGVPRHNSRTERPRKPKIGRMEAHHMGIQWNYLEVKRSRSSYCSHSKCPISSEREGLRTSNLVYRWSTKTNINDKCAWPSRSRSQGHVMHLTGVGR